jgi:hypothetical protein
MIGDQPEQRLAYIKQQHSERIARAAADRSAALLPRHSRPRFVGLHVRLGDLLIVVGRTLCDEDGLSLDLVR